MPLLAFDFTGAYAPDQGASWIFDDATWKDANGNPVNMTGYTARMQLRPDHSAKSKAFDTLGTADLDGTIVLGADGTIAINVPPSRTVKYTWPAAYYELKVTSPAGVVTSLLAGRVVPNPAATFPT